MSTRLLLLLPLAVAMAACARPSSTGAARQPSPAVQSVLERAATAQPAAPAAAPTAPPAAPVAPKTPAPPKDIDPVGTYEISLVAQGNALAVTAKVERRADGTYGGTVTSQAIPALPITGVEVSGKSMKVYVTGPGGESVVLNLVLDGDVVSGDWAMGNDGSSISGKKLP